MCAQACVPASGLVDERTGQTGYRSAHLRLGGRELGRRVPVVARLRGLQSWRPWDARRRLRLTRAPPRRVPQMSISIGSTRVSYCGQFSERVVDVGPLDPLASPGICGDSRKGRLRRLRARLRRGWRELNDHRPRRMGRHELSPRQHQDDGDNRMQQQGHREAYPQTAPAHRPFGRRRRDPRVRRQPRWFRRLRRAQHLNSPPCSSERH